MVMVASETGSGAPRRDIGHMFRTQEDKLREFTVYDTSPLPAPPFPVVPAASILPGADGEAGECVDGKVMEEPEAEDNRYHGEITIGSSSPMVDEEEDDNIWEEQEGPGSQRCQICQHAIPIFAMSAHQRFHAMDE
ncbi:hypothetical protein NUW58_g9882 [Xylaria curta]|uniref:Uncharacterized protein n=1 Tax=Xylaria curta TaxID=42375 RepID=A0ACC1MT26_9PEZI|nr:hypothetical protein NUW58_g9882 [Xylaria curta]